MNFLQLCQRLHLETGMSEVYDFSNSNPLGEQARIRSWINDAYLRIQTMYPNWSWLWFEGSFVAMDGYVPDTVGEFISVIVDDVELDRVQELKQGESLTAYTIKPNGQIAFNAPANSKTVHFTAYRKPMGFSGNNDTPLIPEQYQMLIVWMALQDYAIYDEALELVQKSALHSANMLAELTRSTLPAVQLPGALV